MNKKLLSEIERMKELAGILNEEHFTQDQLMQQDTPGDFDQLINTDLSSDDSDSSEENSIGSNGTYSSAIDANEKDVNMNNADDNQESVFDDVPLPIGDEGNPVDNNGIPTDESTPSDLAANTEQKYFNNTDMYKTEPTPEAISKNAEENLYPGKYKAMYAGENMMENDNPISKMDDDSEIVLDI